MSYGDWKRKSDTYNAWQAASTRCANVFGTDTAAADVHGKYGNLVDFWRIGGQTLQIRECQWLSTSRSAGSRREGETNGPRFTAARARAIAALGGTEAEAAAIIAWHLDAAKAGHSDDTTGWEAYRSHTRDRMHTIRKNNK